VIEKNDNDTKMAMLISADTQPVIAGKRTMPTHRKILLWLVLIATAFCALQVAWRVWLLNTGDAVVGEVRVATDSCQSRHRANCFLGRAVVNPRMDSHIFKVTKIPGGRFYSVGEEIPMRVYPNKTFYLAAVYTSMDWLLGPVRSSTVALLWLFSALMPARLKVFWIPPIIITLFLIMG
jgi:hypothetical protein